MTQTLIIFSIATIINVILSTLRSLCTIHANKLVASIMNAVCYGFYTWVIVLTVNDLALGIKIAVTAIANFIGVYIVKLIEEKSRKDKLWKVEIAIPANFNPQDIRHLLEQNQISNNFQSLENWIIFNCYCMEQAQTAICEQIAKNHNGKISAYESKIQY